MYSFPGSCGGEFSLHKHTVLRFFFKILLCQLNRYISHLIKGNRSAPKKHRSERPIPNIEVLPHLLPPVPHDRLVFADAQLLAVHEAGALGPGLIFVVGVLLQVLLAETGLLLVIWLFL